MHWSSLSAKSSGVQITETMTWRQRYICLKKKCSSFWWCTPVDELRSERLSSSQDMGRACLLLIITLTLKLLLWSWKLQYIAFFFFFYTTILRLIIMRLPSNHILIARNACFRKYPLDKHLDRSTHRPTDGQGDFSTPSTPQRSLSICVRRWGHNNKNDCYHSKTKSKHMKG